MADPVIVVSVVRDLPLYNRLFVRNRNLELCDLRMIDNRGENRAIPVCYNRFIEQYGDAHPAWFIFCHEDFEFREPIFDRVNACPTDALYGPIGIRRVNCLLFSYFPFQGVIKGGERDGTGVEHAIGKRVGYLKEVDTFDCCCLVVHSSLIRRHGLRFDENLLFDFYVEDFCASSRLNHGICSRILPMDACHHSNSVPTERLFRHIPYLKEKYPKTCIPSTCGLFGTLSPYLKFQKWLQRKATSIGRKLTGRPFVL